MIDRLYIIHPGNIHFCQKNDLWVPNEIGDEEAGRFMEERFEVAFCYENREKCKKKNTE